MKKQNKFVKKLTLELIEQEIKKQNYSKEKQEEINKMVKESFEKSNQPLTESKESIKRKFENSFYVAKGREYTSAMSLMETQQHAEIFKEVLFEGVKSAEPPIISGYSLAIAFKITPEVERVATSLPPISGRIEAISPFNLPSILRVNSAY